MFFWVNLPHNILLVRSWGHRLVAARSCSRRRMMLGQTRTVLGDVIERRRRSRTSRRSRSCKHSLLLTADLLILTENSIFSWICGFLLERLLAPVKIYCHCHNKKLAVRKFQFEQNFEKSLKNRKFRDILNKPLKFIYFTKFSGPIHYINDLLIS